MKQQHSIHDNNNNTQNNKIIEIESVDSNLSSSENESPNRQTSSKNGQNSSKQKWPYTSKINISIHKSIPP